MKDTLEQLTARYQSGELSTSEYRAALYALYPRVELRTAVAVRTRLQRLMVCS